MPMNSSFTFKEEYLTSVYLNQHGGLTISQTDPDGHVHQITASSKERAKGIIKAMKTVLNDPEFGEEVEE